MVADEVPNNVNQVVKLRFGWNWLPNFRLSIHSVMTRTIRRSPQERHGTVAEIVRCWKKEQAVHRQFMPELSIADVRHSAYLLHRPFRRREVWYGLLQKLS